MKNVENTDVEKTVLNKQFVIETVFDELNFFCQIEHDRYR
ncbi:transposase [Salmonella enterica]|nr:transposase [Salmonella enterica]